MKPLSNILYIIKAVCTENESGSGLLNGFFNPFSFYPHLCNTFHYDRSAVKVFMNDRKYLGIFFSVIFIREHGIKSVQQLDEYIQKTADERQHLQDKIKSIDKEMEQLSATMEQVHTVKKYRGYYKEYRSNPSDKAFFEEYKTQITLYENALSELKKSYSKLPNSKEILSELDKLQEKKNTLMHEYSSSKSTMDELYQIRKNYGIYMGKEMER